jgi:hypothetical protein
MKRIQKRLKKKDLRSEVLFDFNHPSTRVDGDKLFLKVKKSSFPIEIDDEITFVKTLNYTSGGGDKKIVKTFTVSSVNGDIIEITNPVATQLWCNSAIEYSQFEVAMDNNDTKRFNYLCTGFTDYEHYFVLDFDNEHYINKNDTFRLVITRESKWAMNNVQTYNTKQELDCIPIKQEKTFYVVKYFDEEGRENVTFGWDSKKEEFFEISDEEKAEFSKNEELANSVAFYKHFGRNIDGKKLQIIISRESFLDDWGYMLPSCRMRVVYDIDGEVYDDRVFFKENGEKVILSDNVTAMVQSNTLTFNVQIENHHSGNLFQENLLNQSYVNEVIDNAIPQISDYEKNIVKPYIQNPDGTFRRAHGITFNLHFRDRMNGNQVFEKWTTDDSKYWNEYNSNDFQMNKSDLLYYLGFDEDDVHYQKLKLQKSFLRLSFYDDYHPTTQNLLFYSTIFIDSGAIYGTYNKLKTKVIDGEVQGWDSDKNVLLLDKEDLPRISSQFRVTDKFDMSKSSEGFYLYLFNKILPKKAPETIYMKVEFNHAKYGKTIPFLYFTDNTGQPSSSPRENYIISDNKGGEVIDMESYFQDLHIKLEMKYDEETRSYIYYIPHPNKQDNDIILNLFEPRINK